MKDIYIRSIAGHTGVRDWQVENCVKLLDEGAAPVQILEEYLQ